MMRFDAALIPYEEELEPHTGRLKTATVNLTVMSADGSMILFEGFLQKRKDHMVCQTVFTFNVFTLRRNLPPICMLTENEVGNVLVQASEHDLVLLYKKERQRRKYTFTLA